MENISLQLCSINDYMVKDFVGTIKKVAEIGYTGVEFAGYGGLTALEIKDLLAQTGLEAVATHLGLDEFKNNLDAQIAFAKEAGIPILVCPYTDTKTREQALALAEFFRGFVKKCNENGVEFAYHNHSGDMIKDDGDIVMDILFENTPGLKCELDVYWAEYAGINALEYMKKFKGILPLIHLKELGAGDERPNVEIGTGILDFPKIIKLAKELGTTGFVVEQERYKTNPMESAKNNFEYLKNL